MKYAKWKMIVSALAIAAPWAVVSVAEGRLSLFAFAPIFLAGHFLCLHFTAKDPGNAEQSRKVMDMLLWILPVISLFCAWNFRAGQHSGAAGIYTASIAFFGILCLVIGNYLPKCRQNSTVGIKIKWTLENEENWNATHRFGGRVWFLCGFGFFLLACLPVNLAVPGLGILVIIMVGLPTVYSWRYACRQKAAGTYTVSRVKTPKMGKGSLVILAILGLIVVVLMFTGTVNARAEDTHLTVNPSYYPSVRIDYADITQIELLNTYDGGMRTFGLSSPKLSLGNYSSPQFGPYLRYTCNSCKSAIEIRAGEKIYLVSAADEAQTKALFDAILPHIGG